MVLLSTHNTYFDRKLYTVDCEKIDYMGLDARKPVFGELGTTQAQTSLRISADWSAPLLFAFQKVLYVNLLQVKFQFSS